MRLDSHEVRTNQAVRGNEGGKRGRIPHLTNTGLCMNVRVASAEASIYRSHSDMCPFTGTKVGSCLFLDFESGQQFYARAGTQTAGEQLSKRFKIPG